MTDPKDDETEEEKAVRLVAEAAEELAAASNLYAEALRKFGADDQPADEDIAELRGDVASCFRILRAAERYETAVQDR